MSNEIILSGSEETLKPIITLLVALKQMLGDNPPIIYGIPANEIQAERRFKPQILLYFEELKKEIQDDYPPITGQIQIRLMEEESETLTDKKLEVLAKRIKTKFGGTTPFIWHKGKEYYNYTDKKKGYQLQLLCSSIEEAKRLIEQVLDIQSHSPDWKRLTKSNSIEPSIVYPARPDKKLILGKLRRLPRRRPLGNVVFRYASISIWGIPEPIVLVDNTGFLKSLLR